jgi:SAM-dependent methyltransferase
MSAQRLLPTIAPLTVSADALAAIGAALHLRVSGEAAPPEIAQALDAVVTAIAGEGALSDIAPGEATALAGLVRGMLLQTLDLLQHPARASGWEHTDPRVLQAQGLGSASFPPALAAVLPSIDGLGARLEANGASFLDVGVGVAWLSIAMCRQWPALTAVGIDPHEPALAIARRNLAEQSLEGRITLRAQKVEELDDVSAFDLAWLPAPFLPSAILEAALANATRALRPGGWLLLARLAGSDPLSVAIATLRTVRFGGRALSTNDAEALLTRAGLTSVRTLPRDTWAPGLLTVGRRAQ